MMLMETESIEETNLTYQAGASLFFLPQLCGLPLGPPFAESNWEPPGRAEMWFARRSITTQSIKEWV